MGQEKKYIPINEQDRIPARLPDGTLVHLYRSELDLMRKQLRAKQLRERKRREKNNRFRHRHQ